MRLCSSHQSEVQVSKEDALVGSAAITDGAMELPARTSLCCFLLTSPAEIPTKQTSSKIHTLHFVKGCGLQCEIALLNRTKLHSNSLPDANAQVSRT